ncbi:sugar ABC transporter ATP-binding protein [Suilimivivens aceti]|uniref:Sugar ABC transporter ATP-binding protein n=1 Tax=Suilimivivens aceti TaxID=2981774 RepID=A0ABT2T1K0_9FIRM|nr:sugar ABC transporter ATP-binding protein [Suilimivivens aceti]MCU6744137.1 sugar ABC transporter ATP-binding protein [Suilimivivens aceti]SCH56012.1 Arabinose import ATP-binding protein AraG [uncultured Clostridium sp.]
MKETLRLERIVKKFPGVVALDHVNLKLAAGEVLALAGENGAGKSTLIKIISGAYQADEGDIYFNGTKMGKYTPKEAIDKGIAVIYQELSYMQYMSIAENIFLGNLPKKKGCIDYKKLGENSRKVQEEVGLGHLDPFTKVQFLSTAEKQLLEIARAYARNANVLILDEPTSALNEEETKILFDIVRNLQKEGKSVIYISHKLDEIFEICTDIQIMRDGKKVYEGKMDSISKDQIISEMVGRNIDDMYPVSERTIGDKVIEIKNLNYKFLKDISLAVRQGEIVGLYGLMGSGCSETLEALFGARKADFEEYLIDGKEVQISSPADAIRAGLAYTPGERKTEGLILVQSVMENISTVTLKNYRKGPFLNLRKERTVADRWIETLNIKTPSPDTPVSSLSGGNQQKVILSKWLDNNPKLFLLNEPTKGIDVGAKVEIYKQIEDICKRKCGVLLVTSDLPELLGICDRVYILHEGVLVKEIDKNEMTKENVLKYALGEE